MAELSFYEKYFEVSDWFFTSKEGVQAYIETQPSNTLLWFVYTRKFPLHYIISKNLYLNDTTVQQFPVKLGDYSCLLRTKDKKWWKCQNEEELYNEITSEEYEEIIKTSWLVEWKYMESLKLSSERIGELATKKIITCTCWSMNYCKKFIRDVTFAKIVSNHSSTVILNNPHLNSEKFLSFLQDTIFIDCHNDNTITGLFSIWDHDMTDANLIKRTYIHPDHEFFVAIHTLFSAPKFCKEQMEHADELDIWNLQKFKFLNKDFYSN